jgi:FkbM family methyltransferase
MPFFERGWSQPLNPWVIKARSLARKAGVIGLINRFWPVGEYEKRVHQSLQTAIRPGDVAWDVGANVGLYTELFCQWVGENGQVVAFEPLPASCERIRQRLPNCAWLRVENVALGDTDSIGMLITAADSVENRLASASDLAKGGVGLLPVAICRADTLRTQLGRDPNVIKIDVEGFEGEVLAGMEQLLGSPVLHSLLVEVHFLKLERRGRLTAPHQMERLLKSKGFRTKWVDASHLFATRPRTAAPA